MRTKASAPVDATTESEWTFLRRLAIVTFSFLLVLALIYFLREFQSILQPLFIAIFLSYIVVPAHRWLVSKNVPSTLAYIGLLVFLVGCLVGMGTLLYNNLTRLAERLPGYEASFEVVIEDALATLGYEEAERKQVIDDLAIFDPMTAQDAIAQARRALGTFFNFFGMLAITGVYLVFVVIERGNFTRRISQALTSNSAQRVLLVATNINQAITEYLSVKTFVSFMGGLFTMAILAVFNVDFFITWGILAFVLNFIPYLGSLVATLLPVLLSLVQLGLWQAVAIAVLLVAMQQFLGVVFEPRLAGRRLNVSPLLILLALSFWGVVWGIVGMILAVPLLVSVKIILDNIEETRPIAALMVNLGPPAGPDCTSPPNTETDSCEPPIS